MSMRIKPELKQNKIKAKAKAEINLKQRKQRKQKTDKIHDSICNGMRTM